MVDDDPVRTDPERYRVLWENDRVRVLAYDDEPGDTTHLHHHPDSVMVTLSGFRRRLEVDGREAEVELEAGRALWIAEQSHLGRNIGDSPTHTILVELKEPRPDGAATPPALGPSTPS
ncbi:cytoplasmic protein [Leifsonia sp. F6_8S_P_1B]|uniref:Cytoplasmic protein n=1 Tax=Leifsonia williamsii TaxID=3035919 RepID=A0ABT8K6K1_9MICO|nr:cytoplasmic protein [Leifsonia williamsii]MDN4613088.1 cytoplasmic protein [Leifsonia williamsii]